MSRVTYILGAGASYGARRKGENGEIVEFTRGLPVVNELERALQLLKQGDNLGGVIFSADEAKKRGVTIEQYNKVQSCLSLLEEACSSYPTIDTLAKQLYVTNSPFIIQNKGIVQYEDLKRLITVALLMMQDEKKRDLRYDGFIASLIDGHRNFPPITILSWNYDVQFEMAYSGYFTTERYIPSLWEKLNVFNKMYPTEFNIKHPYAMVKLNGTALFTDTTLDAWKTEGKQVYRITDCFYGGKKEKPYQYGYNYLNFGNYQTLLSYAWEEQNRTKLENIIEQRTFDTRELVVIGYSFPYVNNELDSFMLHSMSKLEKIVVQDKNFEDIKERIEGILEPTRRTVKIVPKNSLQQFYIPNRFV